MADLFYFLSSLPMLRHGMALPFSSSQFLEQCADVLGETVAAKLRTITITPDNTTAVDDTIARWYAFETYLRNTLAEARRVKLKLPPLQNVRNNTEELAFVAKQVDNVMAMTSPVAREHALDDMRLAYLSSLEAEHYYDMASLEIYLIKLKILEKKASQRLAEGREAFNRLLNNGFEQSNMRRINDEI